MIRLNTATFVFALMLVLGRVHVAASPFGDVHEGHFAYEAILFAADPDNGAFMVSDASGNFNPRRQITKFEASRVFALAAGFRHVMPGLSVERQQAQQQSMQIWRGYIDFMSAGHARWSRAHDAEIAYLLYRGILTTDDVEGFVTVDGRDEIQALFNFGDASLWTRRLLGDGDAEASPGEGLMRPITRAELATILHEALYNPIYSQPEPDVQQLLAQINYLAGLHFGESGGSETDRAGVPESERQRADSFQATEYDRLINGRLADVRIDTLSRITIETADGESEFVYVPSNVFDVNDIRVGMLVSVGVVGSVATEISVWGFVN